MDYPSSTQQDDQQQYQQHQYQQQDSLNLSQYRHQSYEFDQNSSHNPYSHTHHQYPFHHFPQDFANSYAHQTHHQFHHQPTSIHPPGVPILPPLEPNDPQSQQNGYYYPPGSGSDPGSGFGLDPAVAGGAVAAISQLTQFSGNVDAAQRALHVPIGHTPFRGGRRGNRPFRGGRGHFGRHGPRLDGSGPSFRGRGRGQGGSRHFGSHGAVFTNPNSASASAEGEAASVQQPSASVPGQVPLPVPVQVPAAPFCRPPRLAWCELCRVDCNTPEILEQHKNGKRHKKNLQVFEELQKLNKVTTGQQNAQMPNTELKTDVGQPEKVEGNQPLSQNTSQAVSNDNSTETEQQHAAVDNSETSAEPERKQQAQFPATGRGSKRKMRGGRGGKYMRGNEGSRRPVEPPKPKQVIPLICELCNVKCESQVVFDSHLTGKKHQTNLKRFHGHRALYGEAGLQALYPPNFNAPSTSFVPQVQQTVQDPQVLLAQLLMTYVLSHAQAPGAVGFAPNTAPAPGSSSGTQNQPESQTPGTELTPEDGKQNAPSAETKSELQSPSTEYEAPPAAGTDTKTEGDTSDVAAKDVHVSNGNAVIVPEEVSATVSDKALSSKQCEVVSSGPVVQQEEPKNEESTQ